MPTGSADPVPGPSPLSAARWGAWIGVLLVAAVLQSISAARLGRDLDSPNASSMTARYMLATGEYGVMLWDRLVGEEAAQQHKEPLRMFQLPAEPLFDYAVFRWVPSALQPFAHIPFALLLIAAVMAVGTRLGGWRAGMLAGGIMTVHPWMVYHAPVRDDLMIASSCEWASIALLLSMFSSNSSNLRRWAGCVALFALAGAASMARLQSQVILVMAALVSFLPRFRPCRKGGVAVMAGIAVALFGWGLRNDRLSGHWVLGSSHDGFVLYESNYEHAKESILVTGQTDGLDAHYMRDDYRAAQGLNEVEIDRYYRKRGVDEILHRPHLELLSEWCYKAVHSLLGIKTQWPLLSARNLVMLVPTSLLYLGSFAGLLAIARRPRRPDEAAGCLFLSALALVSLGMLFIGPMAFRYQISIVGICAVLTSAALCPTPLDEGASH